MSEDDLLGIHVLFIIILCTSHWYALGKGRERRRHPHMEQNQPSSKEDSGRHEVMDERISLRGPGGNLFHSDLCIPRKLCSNLSKTELQGHLPELPGQLACGCLELPLSAS